MPPPEPSTHDIRAVSLVVRRLALGIDSARRRFAERYGVGPTEALAMGLLFVDGPQPARALAKGLRLTTGATTAVVDRLVAQDLAGRERHPTDRRSVIIALTTQGRDAVSWIYETSEERAVRRLDELVATGALDARSLEAGLVVMTAIADALDVAVPASE